MEELFALLHQSGQATFPFAYHRIQLFNKRKEKNQYIKRFGEQLQYMLIKYTRNQIPSVPGLRYALSSILQTKLFPGFALQAHILHSAHVPFDDELFQLSHLLSWVAFYYKIAISLGAVLQLLTLTVVADRISFLPF